MLGANFMKHDYLRNENFSQIDVFDNDSILSMESIVIGSMTHEYIESIRILDDQSEKLQKFYINCQNF